MAEAKKKTYEELEAEIERAANWIEKFQDREGPVRRRLEDLYHNVHLLALALEAIPENERPRNFKEIAVLAENVGRHITLIEGALNKGLDEAE